MRSSVVVLLLLLLGLLPYPSFANSGDKASHLFFIERSKNRNIVQYDIGLTENRDLLDSHPVNAYWVLENGMREELNSIERRFGYGIIHQEKLGKDKLKFVLAAFKRLEIVVEKINDSFNAVVSINGEESLLQKIYIKAEEKGGGLPRVLYMELFGRTKEAGLPVKERITPK